MSGTIHLRSPYALKECIGTVFHYSEVDALKKITSFWKVKESYVFFLQGQEAFLSSKVFRVALGVDLASYSMQTSGCFVDRLKQAGL
jgi:hypothetical protein